MSSLTATDEQISATPAKVIQPAWVRVMHWTNAVAMILMIMSGWQIYNASPLFGFRFSHDITLGGWLGGAPALALCGDVAVDGQRPRLSRHRSSPPAASAKNCCRSRRRACFQMSGRL